MKKVSNKEWEEVLRQETNHQDIDISDSEMINYTDHLNPRFEIAIIPQLALGFSSMDKVIHIFLPFLTIAIETRKYTGSLLEIMIVKY